MSYQKSITPEQIQQLKAAGVEVILPDFQLSEEIQVFAFMMATHSVMELGHKAKEEAGEEVKQRGMRFIVRPSEGCVICDRPVMALGVWDKNDGTRFRIYGLCKKHVKSSLDFVESAVEQAEINSQRWN